MTWCLMEFKETDNSVGRMAVGNTNFAKRVLEAAMVTGACLDVDGGRGI